MKTFYDKNNNPIMFICSNVGNLYKNDKNFKEHLKIMKKINKDIAKKI